MMGENEITLFRTLDLMKRLERDLAVLYSVIAEGVHDAIISSIMRKIGIESATHSYILALIEPLIRECPPRRITDTEYLISIQNNIEEALNHVHEIMDFVNSRVKVGSEEVGAFLVEKLNELEDFESNATKVYSFLLRSYLPITSTRVDTKRRATSKLIVKLLKGIADDEREHGELLMVVNELLGVGRVKK